MSFSFSQKVTALDDVLVQELAGEAVLLNLKTEQYLGLDPVGTRMRRVLTSAASIAAAADTLLAEYEVERGRLEADLRKFIEQLLEHGLVTVSG